MHLVQPEYSAEGVPTGEDRTSWHDCHERFVSFQWPLTVARLWQVPVFAAGGDGARSSDILAAIARLTHHFARTLRINCGYYRM